MSAKKKPRKHLEKKPTNDVFLEPELTWANVNLQDCDAVNQMTEQPAHSRSSQSPRRAPDCRSLAARDVEHLGQDEVAGRRRSFLSSPLRNSTRCSASRNCCSRSLPGIVGRLLSQRRFQASLSQ
jgi:hypothetical protein